MVTEDVRPFGDLQGLVGLRGYLTEKQPVIAFKGGGRGKLANRDLHFPVTTKYKDYNWINHATEINDPSLPTAVFISDLFGDYVMPYLSENFRQVPYIRQPQPGHNDMDVIDAEKPDMVIELRMSAGLGCYTLEHAHAVVLRNKGWRSTDADGRTQFHATAPPVLAHQVPVCFGGCLG